VCVEDEFSKLVLTEILRRADAKLLKVVAIESLGSSQSVSNGIRLLEKLGFKAIGVRDADVGPDPTAKLYSLPGAKAPELEVFTNAAVVQKLKDVYVVDVAALLAQEPDLDPHEIPARLASEAELLKDALSTDAAQAYAASLDPAAYSDVVEAIRAAA
jgi:hypothetical protein